MRILIITTFFPPLNSIASLRPHSFAKYWSREGHDVTVLTTTKNLNPDLDLNVSSEKFKLIEVPNREWISEKKQAAVKGASDNQLVHWLKSKGVFNATRMPDLTHFWIKPALKRILQEDPFDLVVSLAGPYPVHILAHRLKKRKHAKRWIADYRDMWTKHAVFPGLFPFNLIEPLLEKYLLKSTDCITTVSEPLAEVFQKRFPKKKVAVIENGFDPDDLQHLSEESCFPSDGKIRIVHTGSLYPDKRDPTPLFEAIRALAPDWLEVLFVGPKAPHLEKLIEQYQVAPWVKIGGFISREKALQMQRDANYLLFLPWNDPKVDGVLTGKLFEYLFTDTPILAVGAPHFEVSQKLIQEAEGGICCHDTDSVIHFLQQIQHRSSPSPKKQEVIKRYHRKTLAEKVLQL